VGAFHLGHVLGEGGLAQVHGLRRSPEAPGLGHGQEHLELPEGGLHKTYLMGSIQTSDWSLCKRTSTLNPVDVLRLEPGIRLVAFVAAFVLLAAGESLIPRRARAITRRGASRPTRTSVSPSPGGTAFVAPTEASLLQGMRP
jgi:hypothetical protein